MMGVLGLGLRTALGYRRSLMPVGAVAIATGIAVMALLAFVGANSIIHSQLARVIGREPVLTTVGAGPVILHKVDAYEFGVIERFVVAGADPTDPAPPGLPRLPRAGEVFLSPALVDLSATESLVSESLPGRVIGSVGDSGLRSPAELVAWIGVAEHQVEGLHAVGFGDPQSVPELLQQSYRPFYWAAALLLLGVPIVVLVSVAARSASKLRQHQVLVLRALGASARQVATMLVVGLALAAVAGGAFGAILIGPLFGLIQRIQIPGTEFFRVDLEIETYQAFIAIAIASLLACAAAHVTITRAFTHPIPRRPSMVTVRPHDIGLVLILIAVIGIGAVAAPLSLPRVIELATLYGASLLAAAGLGLSGATATRRLAAFSARFARSAVALLTLRKLESGPGAATRLASTLGVGLFVLSVLQPLGSVLGGDISYEQDVLAEQWANGRSLVLVTDVPVAISLESLSNARGLQAIMPIADGFDPSTGENIGRQVLVADCINLQQVALIEHFSCPDEVWGIQSGGTTSTLTATATVELADGSDRIAIKAIGGFIDIGLPATENLDGVLVVSPQELPQLPPGGFVTSTYLAMIDPGSDPYDQLRSSVARLAPSAIVLDSIEYSIGGSRRLLPLLSYLQVLVAAALLLLGVSAALAASESMTDQIPQLSALRMAGAPITTLKQVQAWTLFLPGSVSAVLGSLLGFGIAAVFRVRRGPSVALNPSVTIMTLVLACLVWAGWAWISTLGMGRRLDSRAVRGT